MTNYNSLGTNRLWNFFSIDIEDDGSTQRVFFNSKIHACKRRELPISYPMDTPHEQILVDPALKTLLLSQYGEGLWLSIR